jgi:hypothetical protein
VCECVCMCVCVCVCALDSLVVHKYVENCLHFLLPKWIHMAGNFPCNSLGLVYLHPCLIDHDTFK